MFLFNVPELVDLVGTHLTSHDLTACVPVNKSWNNLITPRLWRAGLKPVARSRGGYRSYHQHRSFYQMVLSDYLLANQQQQTRHKEDDDLHNRPAWTGALTRNGRWVRELSVSDRDFYHRRHSSTTSLPPSETSLPAVLGASGASGAPAVAAAVVVSDPDPTHEELLSHLLHQCTNIQQLDLSGCISTMQSQDFWHNLIRTGLPTTTIIDLNLSIKSNCDVLSFKPVLLIQGSKVLKKLTLQLYCQTRNFPPRRLRGRPEAGETKLDVEEAEKNKDEKRRTVSIIEGAESDLCSIVSDIEQAPASTCMAPPPETMPQPRESLY